MSAPANLSDCYTEELADLWSANDQMIKIVRDLADAAQDQSLSYRLKKAAEGIEKHTNPCLKSAARVKRSTAKVWRAWSKRLASMPWKPI